MYRDWDEIAEQDVERADREREEFIKQIKSDRELFVAIVHDMAECDGASAALDAIATYAQEAFTDSIRADDVANFEEAIGVLADYAIDNRDDFLDKFSDIPLPARSASELRNDYEEERADRLMDDPDWERAA